jgi:hypothetical protein
MAIFTSMMLMPSLLYGCSHSPNGMNRADSIEQIDLSVFGIIKASNLILTGYLVELWKAFVHQKITQE